MKIVKKISYNSPVILTFAFLSLAVLLIGSLSKGGSTTLFFSVYRSSPLSPAFWIRLFGHILGHANLAHYAGNMMLFLLIGPILEERYGSESLLSMILGVAVITGILHIILFPGAALLGASGVVFMMIIMISVTGIKQGEIPLTMIIVAAIYIGQEIISGISSPDNISQLTHIAGGICGGGFSLYGRKKFSA
jgi:membrane associated rhomboid family serine protease